MSWIFESPILISVLGAIGAMVLAIAWASSGKRETAIIAGVWVGLVFVMLLVERLVVTDREQIQILVQDITNDAKSNDPKRLTQHIHSAAQTLLTRANTELPNYNFTMLRITKIHSVEVTGNKVPKTAVVDFNVVAAGSFSVAGEQRFEFTRDEPLYRNIKLFLRQEADGKWRVEDYQHANPTAFMFSGPAPDAEGSR